jgi:hypothetical protein
MATLVFIVIWLAALVATFVPIIPATFVIWLAALLHAVLTGFQPLNWGFLLGLGVLAVAASLVDNLAAAWGARRYGGSSAAGWGALVGGLVGIFLGPLGLLVGPFLGAVVAELFVTGKPLPEALRSGVGTLLGLLGGIGAKFLIHLAMGIIVLVRVFTA